ncbi:hypothetical protein Tdes44962_MAKER04745 [Teratosphaeria destructans]|uniref:Uncharacterized protein n=1 Tax=Teratosphaeria destructans TaxID=418781 RepID=A0A9W7VZG4_9PEZI|nr:hypothetical protein Tdes44962_MAKER04745 [Teratosphaeria destructans]
MSFDSAIASSHSTRFYEIITPPSTGTQRPATTFTTATTNMAGLGRKMPRITTELPVDRPRKFAVPVDLGGVTGPALIEYTNTESVTNTAFRFCMDRGISINFQQKIADAIMDFCGQGNYPNYGFDFVPAAPNPSSEESELRARVEHLYEELASVRAKLAEQEMENQRLRGVSSQGFPSTLSAGQMVGVEGFGFGERPPRGKEEADWRLRDSAISET